MSKQDLFSRRLLFNLGLMALLFAVALAANAASTIHGSEFTPNSDLVLSAPYDTIVPGTANWRANPAREFLTRYQKYRIRQNGDIESIRLYLAGDVPSEFKFRVWREDETGKFDMVGTSVDLASYFNAGPGFYTIPLTTPIAAKEGDYVGYYMGLTTPSILYASASSAGYTYIIDGSREGADDVDFVNGYTKKYAVRVPIETYMQAPSFVFIGDSITQGAPGHRSFLVDTIISGMDGTIPYQFSELSGYTYQNMGIGSQMSAMIAARFQTDVVDLKPRAAVILAGVNDLAGGVSLETYTANMTAMLDLCETNDIIPVVVKILPWSNGTYSQMLEWENFNAALETLVAEYEDGVLVDASAYVGQERPSGPAGNLWDIKPEYNSGGVHFTPAGHGAIAQAIYDALVPEPSLIALLLTGAFCTLLLRRR